MAKYGWWARGHSESAKTCGEVFLGEVRNKLRICVEDKVISIGARSIGVSESNLPRWEYVMVIRTSMRLVRVSVKLVHTIICWLPGSTFCTWATTLVRFSMGNKSPLVFHPVGWRKYWDHWPNSMREIKFWNTGEGKGGLGHFSDIKASSNSPRTRWAI